MSDRIWITIEGAEYWVEGGDFEEMLYAVRDLLQSKFKKRDRTWVVSNTARDAAARLLPHRLIMVIGDSDSVGELVSPAPL